MATAIFHLDAFTNRRFAGNPAAVMPMDSFPSDAVLQAIAGENNLAETAFLVRKGEDYLLRWFTPTTEVPLCGHATLASAVVVMERLEPDRRRVVFHSASGPLTVNRSGAGYVMDFPARFCTPVPTPPQLSAALGVAPVEVVADPFNYLVLLDSAQIVRATCSRYRSHCPHGPKRHHRHSGGRWQLRFCQSLLRAGEGYSRGSRDRLGALRTGALLGDPIEQARLSGVSSFAARRRNPLSASE